MKIRPLIIIALLILTFTNVRPQASAPISERGLLQALHEKGSAKLLIGQVKDRGVEFHLTDVIEQTIRRAGNYLGKKELDSLIEAISSNYRPVILEQPAFQEDTSEITLSLGSVSLVSSAKALRENTGLVLLTVGTFVPARLHIKDDKLYVDASVYGGANSPVEIKNNVFKVRPSDWDINSSPTAMEVVNENGMPVFQLIRKRASFIQINGIFQSEKGRTVLISERDGMQADPTQEQIATAFIPIFKHPAWKYPGQLAESQGEARSSSINQTMTNSPGGIQAAGNVTVNRGLEQRKLLPEQESQFVGILRDKPKGSIEISCIESGGPEPCNFARQIAELMEKAGWTVHYAPLMFGAGDPTKQIPALYILVKKGHVPYRAAVLQTAFKSLGFKAEGIEREDVATDFVQLTVWFNAAP